MKTYVIEVTFENPYMSETCKTNVSVNASSCDEAHLFAIDELEYNLGQSLIVHETKTV